MQTRSLRSFGAVHIVSSAESINSLILHAAHQLVQHSTDLANGLSRLTASENKRRSVYRSETAGQLPWEIKGLDSGLEHVELDLRKSQTGSTGDQDLPEVSRQDVDGLSVIH
jgi:hypothetical protein